VGDLKKRVFSGLVIAPLVLALIIFLPPGPFFIFMAIVLILAVHELTSMARCAFVPAVIVLAAGALIPLYLNRPNEYVLWLLFSSPLYLLFRLLMPGSHGISNSEIGTSIAVLVLSQVFLVIPVYSLCRLKDLGRYFPIVLLLAIWASDTAAYFVGKNIGRYKIALTISPKKTLEGLLGALGGSLVVILLLKDYLALSLLQAAAAGLMIGLLGQLGDLLESVAKRVWQVKDSSSLIPGHGGLLDRLDSLLLTAPFLYCYLLEYSR
jgi:phosphatidate cytidylyltransferase